MQMEDHDDHDGRKVWLNEAEAAEFLNTAAIPRSVSRSASGSGVWCEGRDLLNINELSGRDLDDCWQYRWESLNDVSLKNELSTIKKLLEYLVADFHEEAGFVEFTHRLAEGAAEERLRRRASERPRHRPGDVGRGGGRRLSQGEPHRAD